jgi:D-alanyl-D-alanine carboxypeptidase
MRSLALMRHLIASLILISCIALLANRAVASDTYSGLVVDVDSDRVLYERNADEPRHPASLTKMMTLYLVFEALANGDLYEDTQFRASRYAVSRPPSRLGLAAGDYLSVHDGILALVTRSANDAATVIAEGIAGSEAAFAQMMTDKARELGMSRTVFRNASGLPDPDQWTTARDMYRLGRALYKNFPEQYTYFSTPKFYYQGQGFENHNHLMERYPGMDGIKTGFINSSGFNLVASAKRGGTRLIGVVFGGPSAFRRDEHMREILDDGFAQLLEGAPPGIVTAEFDKPNPRTLLASPRLVESPEPEFDESEPVRPRRTQRMAKALGLDDLPVRPSKGRQREAARVHEAPAAVPVRSHLVSAAKSRHAAAGKTAPEPRQGSRGKATPPRRASAHTAPAPKAAAEKKHAEKKIEVAHNKPAPKPGAAPACPSGKGKPPKCKARS